MPYISGPRLTKFHHPLNLRGRARPCQGTYLTAMTHRDYVWSCRSFRLRGFMMFCASWSREVGRPEHLLPFALPPDKSGLAKISDPSSQAILRSSCLYYAVAYAVKLVMLDSLILSGLLSSSSPHFRKKPSTAIVNPQPKDTQASQGWYSCDLLPLSIAVENRLGNRWIEETVILLVK